MKRVLFGALLVTFCMLWFASGPNWEGLTKYTALAFFSGLLSGVLWGCFFLMWIINDYRKAG